MRITRRRRTPDPLASPEAMRSVCHLLRERLPELIPAPEKELMHFLYALRYAERRVPNGTRRCWPLRWRREVLLRAAGELRFVLRRETSARVSLSSFVGQYLPLLNFPADVVEALSAGRVNLFEAAQLARLTPERLDARHQNALLEHAT